MKKWVILLICAVAAICFFLNGGNVKDAHVLDVESKVYSSEDIDSAIKAVMGEFRRNWKGCILREICYAGDETNREYQEWADINNADEAIVLVSSFEVDSSGGDGSLEPDSIYENWKWILVRSGKGRWKHIDHGY